MDGGWKHMNIQVRVCECKFVLSANNCRFVGIFRSISNELFNSHIELFFLQFWSSYRMRHLKVERKNPAESSDLCENIYMTILEISVCTTSNINILLVTHIFHKIHFLFMTALIWQCKVFFIDVHGCEKERSSNHFSVQSIPFTNFYMPVFSCVFCCQVLCTVQLLNTLDGMHFLNCEHLWYYSSWNFKHHSGPYVCAFTIFSLWI